MENEIVSIYIVTNYRTGYSEEVAVDGDGQQAATAIRAKYPRHTKFVLDGFEINGEYIPLYFKNRH